MTSNPDNNELASTYEEATDWPVASHSLLASSGIDHLHAFVDWWPLTLGRRLGYQKAAEILSQAMLDAHPSERDTLVFPWLMCWRHYVELELKYMLQLCEGALQSPEKNRAHHKILQLWQELKPLLVRLRPTDETAEITIVNRLITELASLDPDSMHSRYSNLKDGTPTMRNVKPLDVVEFHNAMSGMAAFFGGVTSAIEYDEEIRQEVRREYEGGF
ncbi:hypothetical protein [Pseudonocardia sp. MH-G8]|uniref:hypothetical protein n=1 Tax=Pseudonocardia sp. MH-G8 TaxID=1854588 RepID=UPI000BA0A15F|nr:hypothetical protein [Pseudonocardia sp. MH-G8]OZM76662.1 hypothetical protein CFP66_39820 [Pseudonocardia sp. MH-G8]